MILTYYVNDWRVEDLYLWDSLIPPIDSKIEKLANWHNRKKETLLTVHHMTLSGLDKAFEEDIENDL